ncbi:hypothetical protein PbJCM13498_26530 [Prolixibacter bellariivorans]|uniref:Uncharacterized protein n=1 Tax=Prolixibacter bellariivorans TaxID=314319 RepID=A0A5M4B0V5_9BACT|nr:hypothetical protein PbJCM13498_26530 [Prolixibacter bellariivorans]
MSDLSKAGKLCSSLRAGIRIEIIGFFPVREAAKFRGRVRTFTTAMKSRRLKNMNDMTARMCMPIVPFAA